MVNDTLFFVFSTFMVKRMSWFLFGLRVFDTTLLTSQTLSKIWNISGNFEWRHQYFNSKNSPDTQKATGQIFWTNIPPQIACFKYKNFKDLYFISYFFNTISYCWKNRILPQMFESKIDCDPIIQCVFFICNVLCLEYYPLKLEPDRKFKKKVLLVWETAHFVLKCQAAKSLKKFV